MKILCGVILALAINAAFAAYTFDPAEQRCFSKNIAGPINLIQKQVDRIDALLPRVPPEEEKYLTEASKRALDLFNRSDAQSKAKGNQLSFELSNRKSFDVWKVRKAIGPTKDALSKVASDKSVFTYRANLNAERIDKASRALYSLSALIAEAAMYYNKHSAEYNEQDAYTLLGLSGSMTEMGNFINCNLAHIMGNQSW